MNTIKTPASAAISTYIMKRRDIDRDGFVAPTEMKMDQAAWHRLDTNGNGFVTKAEMATAMAKVDPDRAERFEYSIRKWNFSGDLEPVLGVAGLLVLCSGAAAVVGPGWVGTTGAALLAVTIFAFVAIAGIGETARKQAGTYREREAEVLESALGVPLQSCPPRAARSRCDD